MTSRTTQAPFNVANYPTTARTSLPPDNLYQKFSLSGGLNLPFSSRLTALAEYGIMEQDEELLPYSNNSASTITAPLPRSGADARIDTGTLLLNLTSRPINRLGVSAKYKYYIEKNRTPRDLFRYVKNDTGGAQAALTDSHAVYNLPYDYEQNLWKLDASYYLLSGTTLKAGYDCELIDRDYREVKEAEEGTYRLALQTQAIPRTSLSLNYSFAERNARDPYDQARLYNEYHTAEYINSVASNLRFDNHPLMRKFDIADRSRTRYVASATFIPSDLTSVGLHYSYSNDNFHDTELGLKSRLNESYTVDTAFSPAESATVYAFYTKEYVRTDEDSRSYSGAAKAAQSVDEGRNWGAELADEIDTIGVGTKLGFMENRLTFDLDYSYSESNTNISFTAGSSLTSPVNMPDLKTNLHAFSLTGKYGLTNSITLGAGYRFESYESDDWQTDGFEAGSSTIANVITLSDSTPDYEAHQAMVYVTYHMGK